MRKAFIIVLAFILVLSMTAAAFADSDLSASDIKAMKPSGVKAATYSYSKIKVSWDKMDGVDGYQVYRSTSKNGTYKRAYSTADPDKNWYINTGRTTGKTYYYKVRGYKEISGKKVYTNFSAIKSAYARPNKVKNVAIGTSSSDEFQIFQQFDVTWDSVKGADGYQVYISEQGADEYSRVGNYKGTYANFDIPDTGKLYDIKVRAYCIVNGKKVYGYFSKATTYEIEWTAEMLKKAAEDYLIETYKVTLKDRYSDGTMKVPWEGTSWSVIWPLAYSYYRPWEWVKNDIQEMIDLDMEVQGELNYMCMFLDYENADPNYVYIYMII